MDEVSCQPTVIQRVNLLSIPCMAALGLNISMISGGTRQILYTGIPREI